MKLTHSRGTKSFRKLCLRMQKSRATVKYFSDNFNGSRGKIIFFPIRNGIKIFTFHNKIVTLPSSHLRVKVDAFSVFSLRYLSSGSDLTFLLYSFY